MTGDQVRKAHRYAADLSALTAVQGCAVSNAGGGATAITALSVPLGNAL